MTKVRKLNASYFTLIGSEYIIGSSFFFSIMSNINDQELVKELQKQINELLNNEELKDLDIFLTEKEIDTLIAVEQGQAFQVTLDRNPLPPVCKFFFLHQI
jgi:hypothetical protein